MQKLASDSLNVQDLSIGQGKYRKFGGQSFMISKFETPLPAVVVIFICSLLAAVVTFKFLESTADYHTATGIKVGGALAGLLITFLLLWKAFHTFSKELAQTDREKLEAQLRNAQNQLLRQDPPPPGYRRVINEDYKLIGHIPKDWVFGESTFMTIFAPGIEAQSGFMHNIVFTRKPAIWAYREVVLGQTIAELRKKYAPENQTEFKTRLAKLQLGRQEQEDDPRAHTHLEEEVEALKAEFAADKNPQFVQETEKLQWKFQQQRDQPQGQNERIDNILELFLRSDLGELMGVAEKTEVNGFSAVRYQLPNPVWTELVSLMTHVYVNAGDGYIYTVTLTAPRGKVGDASIVYNKILNSLRFIT